MQSLRNGEIKKQIPFKSLFSLAFLLMAIGYFIMAFNKSYFGIISGLTISSLGIGLLLPNGNVWLIKHVPVSNRGKIIGTMSSMLFFCQFVSPLIIALIISQFNLTYAFHIAFGSMAVLAIIFYLSNFKNQK
ncbi:MFS transporter [Aequorivita sinensis]|uniref:MFS transporter n=1 Tax=Aequorivita sinensis TaxID=1382458 RepID=UPI00111F4B80|nr:MFS transporter [Aequorivita sinensis]